MLNLRHSRIQTISAQIDYVVFLETQGSSNLNFINVNRFPSFSVLEVPITQASQDVQKSVCGRVEFTVEVAVEQFLLAIRNTFTRILQDMFRTSFPLKKKNIEPYL